MTLPELPPGPVPSNQFPWIAQFEQYGFALNLFDVQKVREELAKLEIMPDKINVKSWLWLAGMTAMDSGGVEPDLRVPVLLIELPGEEIQVLLVDGYHRLRKAEKLGVEELPAYVLPVEHFFKVAINLSKNYSKFKPKRARKPRAAKV